MAVVAAILLAILALASADPLRSVSPLVLGKPATPADIPHGSSPYEVRTPVDQARLNRYSPLQSNQYHLFTRQNPTTSQPLIIFNNGVLHSSNYDFSRRTIILIHGYEGNSTSPFNSVMIPAILTAANVNLIVLDWTEGTSLGVPGVYLSANSVADFVIWSMYLAEATRKDYHLIGLGVGGQFAAIASRLAGKLGHVTVLDPPSWIDEEVKLRQNDADYVEVMFTNFVGLISDTPNGWMDFFPNGGWAMPGCAGNWACSHARSYFYMAESITRGGFLARRCPSLQDAMAGSCPYTSDIAKMGDIYINTYALSGSYHLSTNAEPPFSQNLGIN